MSHIDREKYRKMLAIFLVSKMEIGRAYTSNELKNLIHTDSLLIDYHKKYTKECYRRNTITEYSDRWKRFLLMMDKIGYVKLIQNRRYYTITRIK